MSSVVVDVQPTKVIVEMNIMTEDLALYHELETGTDNRIPAADLRKAATLHETFLTNFFHVISAEGKELPAANMQKDTAQIDEEGLYPADLMQFSVIYQFEYPLQKPQPYLTFSQDFGGGGEGVMPARMDLMILQTGQWIENPVQLDHGATHTVAFDWEKGPPPPARGFDEIQRRNEIERRKKLGITSYSGVYSFIYLEPYEARLELLIPLMTFETWMPLDRKDPSMITVEEQKAAAALVEPFLKTNVFTTINGEEIAPRLSRLDFYGLDFKDFARRPTPKDLSIYHARMGIILTFPSAELLNEVVLKWEKYTKRVPFIRADVFVDDEPPYRAYFEPVASEFKWTNEGQIQAPVFATLSPPPPVPSMKLPVTGLIFLAASVFVLVRSISDSRRTRSHAIRAVMVVILGGISAGTWSVGMISIQHPFLKPAALPAEEKELITQSLMNNLYGAFSYRDENAIYDALNRSLSEGALRKVYLQFQSSLHVAEQGGARANIESLEWMELRPDRERPANRIFSMEADWIVEGTVEHWGHIHNRRNHYRADIVVGTSEEQWRILEINILEQEREKLDTSLRD